MTALLELEAVDTYYGQIHILQGVNLSVGKGELVCLLGGNASGKSTTLKTILGIVEPRRGSVRFAGEEITELIAKIRDERGQTILVIEHDMHVVEGISDRVVALDHGVKIAEGSFEQVATDPRVIEAYLGVGAAAARR